MKQSKYLNDCHFYCEINVIRVILYNTPDLDVYTNIIMRPIVIWKEDQFCQLQNVHNVYLKNQIHRNIFFIHNSNFNKLIRMNLYTNNILVSVISQTLIQITLQFTLLRLYGYFQHIYCTNIDIHINKNNVILKGHSLS